MTRTTTITLAGAVVAALIATAALVVVNQTVGVTVMTRNLYLGADITRPLRAVEGRTGRAALVALGRANAELRAVVDATNFPVRSRLLAEEIAAVAPEVVGLQEVALWRHGPLELDAPGRLDAAEVDLDYLALLVDDLAARGLTYEVVGVQTASDVEAPAFAADTPAALADGRDVRLTMRDALLVRRNAGIRVLDHGSGLYRRSFSVDLAGAPYAFVRGFVWADLAAGRSRFRFVTTHLESQNADLARGQAAELLSGPAGRSRRPVVLVCDCNAPPGSAAYTLLTDRGRLRDVGSTAPTGTLGERVDDATPDFTATLDLVLTRSTLLHPVRAEPASRTGADPARRDPSTGLWPSDHAGVAVTLRIG